MSWCVIDIPHVALSLMPLFVVGLMAVWVLVLPQTSTQEQELVNSTE